MKDRKSIIASLLATGCLLGIGQATGANGGEVLGTDMLQSYVSQFNADDEELYSNIKNKDAFAFLEKNIPLFDCPDEEVRRTYYFRWWTYRKHVKATEDGYVVTEFMPKVGWSGKHNTINCPAAHHFYEGRWLHDATILDDYATFWLRKGGSLRSYSFWIADAYFNRNLVTPNDAFLVDLLPDLIKNYEAWEEGWEWGGHKIHIGQRENGLFYTIDDRDGGEVSIGGHGFRPTLNSFMYGDAKAIAAIARMAGEEGIADTYEQKAETLKQLVQEKLWDPEANFFKILSAPHQKGLPSNNAKLKDVRELYGYTPWYFNLPDPGYEAGWSQLMDPQGFYAPYGPTFAEQRHPGFKISYEGHECQWNGPSWPMATCSVLTGLANLLNNYDQDVIGKDDYFETLKIYTKSHQLKREDGRVVPWIDENLNPYTGDWISRTRLLAMERDDPELFKRKGGYERGKDYNHSTYNDLIITGLVGLRPRPDDLVEVNPLLPENTWDWFCLDNVFYHDRILTIIWDKTGERYGKGKGLTVLADGKQIAHADTLAKVTGELGPVQRVQALSAEPIIVAHRGASGDAPENTLAAFNLAWEQGADAVEGDFWLTRDGHIVCIHDRTTKRTAGNDLAVGQSTLSELRELDVGAYRGESFKGERIPKIAEVFSTVPVNKKIYIEVKCGPEIIPVLLKELAASGLQREQVVVISFNEKVIEQMKAKAPEYTANWLCSFKRGESGKVTPSLEQVLGTLERIKADGFSSNNKIPEPVLKSVREHGYPWHVWTLNNQEDVQRACSMGAASVTTDRPAAVRKMPCFSGEEDLPAAKRWSSEKANELMVKTLKSYVHQFNALDEEEGVNTIHNQDALAFMADNIPLFECPDEDVERTYYYRWWTYRKHLRNTPDGWVVTEFYPNVGWAKKHNTINCPVGHQIYEGRWLRDPKYINEYIKFHFYGGGNPGGESKGYSNWLTDAIYAHYLVTGDKAFVTGLLDELIKNHRAYSRDGTGNHSQSRLLEDIGLYWQIDSWDGSELSISGNGVRPGLNSYLYGGAVAIAKVAELAGRPDVAKSYRQEAETLKQTIQAKLWDPDDKFFKTLRDARAKGNYNNANEEECKSGNLVTVRELYGYAPWYFNMPDSGKGYELAWAQLADPQGFKGEYGPGFAERRHPNFFINSGGCVWAGSSWPLATSQVLTGLANLLNNYEQDVIGKQEYFDTLRAYARSHQMKLKDGTVVPWIDESLNQDTGRWITIDRYPKTRGRYYNHSSYNDLIITGLVGLRPRADDVIEVNPLLPDDTWDWFRLHKVRYRDLLLTIIWDRTGEKYGKGKGLTIFVDGRKIAHADGLSKVSGTLE